MGRWHSAAVVTWIYAAAFGLPAIVVAMFVDRNGRLPSFFGAFDLYGGPWSASTVGSDNGRFIALLLAFLALNVVVAGVAWTVWRGSRAGAALNLVTIPVEAWFWIGFALPLPWILAVIRVALIAAAWHSRPRQTDSGSRVI